MKKIISIIRICTPVLLATLMLMGCATSPTPQFYLLRPETPQKNRTLSSNTPAVLIRPVEIAEYLNRPQIVIRKNPFEISISQFNRWAEPLDKQINLYISQILSSELPEFNVKCLMLHNENEAEYEVEIAILTLDGTTGDKVDLTATWKITANNEDGKKTVKEKQVNISEKCGEPGIKGIVTATQELLKRLSLEIAAGFNK